MSSTTTTLQDVASVDDFLNVAATETVPLFEHLEFEFLLEYDVFAPASRGRTRVHQPPDLFRGFLHCYYKDIYGTRPVARELQHGLVWYYCGLDKPPSRDTIDQFLTDLEHESTSHQNSSKVFSTATTKVSTAHAQSHENSEIH